MKTPRHSLVVLFAVVAVALPGRAADLLGDAHPRLRNIPIGIKPPVGTTPVPNKATLKKFEEFAGSAFVDPENVLYLVAGKPRLWTLKNAPVRIQVGDGAVMDYTIAGKDPRELSLLGKRTGITVLNLWFANPDDEAKQTRLSYQINVLPGGKRPR